MRDRIPVSRILELSPDDVHEALQAEAQSKSAPAGLLEKVASLGEAVGAKELNEALEVDAIELLAQGWTKLRDVSDAVRKSRASPDTTTMVTLGEHKVTADCQPVLEIKLADLTLTELTFTLELEVLFKSVKLAIRDARLTALSPGEASVTARLKYGKVKLKEQKTEAWELPVRIELGDGIPLVAKEGA